MAKFYEKVSGLGRGYFWSRMYRSPDHLLIVHSTGFTEVYKRIFFRDIRYVEVRKTHGQMVAGVISGLLLLLFALFFLAPIPAWLSALFCTPFLLWFVVNLALGPVCQCYISTNVQTLKLPTPRRQKKVAVLIGFLREQTPSFEPTAATQRA